MATEAILRSAVGAEDSTLHQIQEMDQYLTQMTSLREDILRLRDKTRRSATDTKARLAIIEKLLAQ
jgi:hypothetical protein